MKLQPRRHRSPPRPWAGRVLGVTLGLSILCSVCDALMNRVVPSVSGIDALMRRVHARPLNPVLGRAVVEHEDRRFYQHGGLDLPGLLRAGWSSVSGGPLEGGSTLTQQLVKNTLLADQHGARTLKRKVQEAWLAQQVEHRYSKTDILKAYLKTAYWGEAGGKQLNGANEAALGYFHLPESRLDLAQSAYLAVLLPSPARAGQTAFLRPLVHLLLDQMVTDGRASRAAADRAWQETLRRN
ncbi:biosynthetic peptidoglycan transglycosylase (plasmid) [Deinococcus radiomollis]|uniref:biosynthetic peptidoglycan transglycosylase n=1 Tax=Deinococcus radiomollis TaxID=468916 RepID=UPI00389154BA